MKSKSAPIRNLRLPSWLSVKYIFIKNHIKKMCLWYLVYSYRLGVVPLALITKLYPGNSGYGFDNSRSDSFFTQELNSTCAQFHPEVENSYFFRAESERYQHEVPPLTNTRSIIVKSRKAEYKIHLQQMYHGIHTQLTHMGSSCAILKDTELAVFLSQIERIPIDFVIIDNEISQGEFLKIIDTFKSFGKRQSQVRFIMMCYDLWRNGDQELVHFVSKYVSSFLHMDPIILEKVFSKKVINKFHPWPIARFWNDSRTYVPTTMDRKQSIFFSGSVRQIDRREILDFVILKLRSSSLETNFHIFDTLIPSSINSKDSYLLELYRNIATLALGQKTSDHWIITGRTVEALASPGGGVLIQQEGLKCSPLSHYLIPFENYLPFRNRGELVEVIQYCEKYPLQVKNIAYSGRSHIMKIFDAKLLVKAIL